MDLGAYSQINDLSKIAEYNDIIVPRLRGYRLMKDEEPITKESINKIMKRCEIIICERLCRASPFWNLNSGCSEYSSWTDNILKYYLVTDIDENGHEEHVDIRWDRIHGWKRKVLKFEIKKIKRMAQKQFDIWNKYAGKDKVLYIHSRIGGGNWEFFDGPELAKSSWFLDKVDDWYDNTYCDIYAKIK